MSPEHFEVGFSEGAKVAFPIVTKSYKLIGNTSTRQSLSVLCLWVFSIVRLLNLVCVVSDRSGSPK